MTKEITKTDDKQLEHTKWLFSNIRHYSTIPLFKKKTLCCFSDAVLLFFGTKVFQQTKITKWSC